MSIESYPSPNGVLTSLIWRKTMSGAETSLSGYDNASQALSYTPGQEQVYLNGILLVRGDDYTATNGTSITGLAALSASDFIQINCYNNFSVASTPSTSIVGTIANNQLANSAITINGSAISLGGSVTLAGDIESVTAGTGISGGGSSGAVTVTNSMATAINAKGDLIVGTADDAFDRLAVSPNSGDTIVADASTSTGLRYQQSFGVNTIINGNADNWQRGTTSAAVAYGTYLADRFKCLNNGTGQNSTYSQSTSVPNGGSLFSLKLQQLTTSATSVTEYAFAQPIETTMVEPLAGKNVVLSFWYRSNKTGNHNARIYAGGQTGGTDITNTFTVSVTNTWEYKTITFTSFAAITAIITGATAEGAILQVGYRTFGGSGSVTVAPNDYFEITQIKLEAGSVATAFSRAGGTIQGELSACLRYYQRQLIQSSRFGVGFAASTTVGKFVINLPQAMRVAPTAIEYGGTIFWFDGVTGLSAGTLTIENQNTVACGLNMSGSSGLTQYRPLGLSGNSSDAYLAFTAEL